MISFLTYSFLGWLAQSAYLTVKSRSFVNAGFLWLPFCPILGFGMLLLILFAHPHHLPPPLLFLACFAAVTIIEYITNLVFELAFQVWLWDYNGRALSINGRTSGVWTLFWAAAATAALLYLQPWLARITAMLIDQPWLDRGIVLPDFLLLASFIPLLLLVDFLFGIRTLVGLKERLVEMTTLREQFAGYLLHSNVCDNPRELLEMDIHTDTLVEAAQRKGIFAVSYGEVPDWELAAALDLTRTQYLKLCRPTFSERRLLGALPLLRVDDSSESLRELKR